MSNLNNISVTCLLVTVWKYKQEADGAARADTGTDPTYLIIIRETERLAQRHWQNQHERMPETTT